MTDAELKQATPKQVAAWLDSLRTTPTNFERLLYLVRFCFNQWHYNAAALRKQKAANRVLREQNNTYKRELHRTR